MNKQPSALQGLRVLELGDFIAGPYAAKLLADLGADVVKIETLPDGDSSRQHGPFPSGMPHPEKSGLFHFLNANKRSVLIDPTNQEHLRLANRLALWADVFITNIPVDDLEHYGLDRTTLERSNPRLIQVAITVFGYDTPRSRWKGYALAASAASGLAQRMGDPGKAPLWPPFAAADYWGGVHGAATALLARRVQRATDRGQHCWISLVEVLGTIMKGAPLGEFVYLGTNRNRTGTFADSFYPWEIAPCKDGYFQIITMVDKQWQRFLELMDNPSWQHDSRLANRWLAPRWAKELDAYWHPWLQRRTKGDLTELFHENQLPFQPINTLEEAIQSEHLQRRSFWYRRTHPTLGAYTMPGAPYKLSNTPWRVRAFAPTLGQHTAELARELMENPGL